MSAAKMVADSTVPTELLGDRRKRRKSSESRRNKRAKKSSNKGHKHDHSSDDSDSDLDLSKDLKEIGDYIKDRQEMLEQMFHAVRGPSLKRALPEILLELPLDDLKKRCLEQLEIMSRKRIRRILEGDNPADISSSGTEESSAEDSQAHQSVGTGEEEEVEYIEIEEEVEVTASEGDEEAVSDREERGPDSEEGEARSEGTAEADDGSLEETIVEEEEDNPEEQVGGSEDEPANEEEEEREASEAGPSQTATRSAVLTKDQMEILELEMRARAIKAMLNKQAKLVEATEMAAAEPNSMGSLSGNESEKEAKDEDISPTRSESVPEIGQGDKEDVLSDGELPDEGTPNDDIVTEASPLDDQQQCDQGNSSTARKNESHEKEPESLGACTKGIPDPTKIVKRKLSSKKKAAIKAREEGKMLFSSTGKKSEPSAKIDEEDTTCQKDTEVSTTSLVETTQNTVDANADSTEGTSKISSHCTEENTAGIVDIKPKLDGIDNKNTDSTERESINTGVITNVVTETRNMEKGSQISKSEEMKSDGPDSEDKQHFAKMEENMNIESKTLVQETSEHLSVGADGSTLVQEERSESVGQVCTVGEEIKAEEVSGSITDEKLVHGQDESDVNSDQSVLKKKRSSPEKSAQIIEDVDSVSEILEFVVNSVVSSMDVLSKKETIESPIQTVETPGRKNESCVGKADSLDTFESENLQKEPLTKGTVDVEKVQVVEGLVLQDKSSLGQKIATEKETLEEKKETVIEKAETVSNEKRSDADRAEFVNPNVVSDASSSGATVLPGGDDAGGSVPENINIKSAVEAEQVEEPDSTCSVTEESEKPVKSSCSEETKAEVEEEEHEEGEVISDEEECSGT